jgi:hypothetical protein
MADLLKLLGIDLNQMERDRMAAEAKGLLGSPAQQAVIAPLGERMNIQLQGAREGSGFLGSGRGVEAQTRLTEGLQQAGYSTQQIQSLLSPAQTAQTAIKPTTLMQNLQAAGVNLETPEGQEKMLEAVMKPQTQIMVGGGVGSIWTKEQVKESGLPTGSVVTVDRYGKPQILTKEKYTQPQILSGGFATRMNTAGADIEKIMATGFDPSGVVQNIDIFGMPDVLANYMRSPEGQQYRQAQVNWITANLRKESGAAIPETETEREIKKWFPQPGDDKDTIKQKARSRKDAERAMQKSAGGAYQELLDKAQSDRLSELRSKHGAN